MSSCRSSHGLPGITSYHLLQKAQRRTKASWTNQAGPSWCRCSAHLPHSALPTVRQNFSQPCAHSHEQRVSACMCPWVHARVCACARACVRVCVHACICMHMPGPSRILRASAGRRSHRHRVDRPRILVVTVQKPKNCRAHPPNIPVIAVWTEQNAELTHHRSTESRARQDHLGGREVGKMQLHTKCVRASAQTCSLKRTAISKLLLSCSLILASSASICSFEKWCTTSLEFHSRSPTRTGSINARCVCRHACVVSTHAHECVRACACACTSMPCVCQGVPRRSLR